VLKRALFKGHINTYLSCLRWNACYQNKRPTSLDVHLTP